MKVRGSYSTIHPTLVEIFTDINVWRGFRKALLKKGEQSLGFVPTMGALHAGHASLVKRAKADNEATCVSIYVNPTQFNVAEDFEKYPRILEKDFELLKSLGVDYAIAPKEVQALYPANWEFQVQEKVISSVLEGQFRPGHFEGMLTVVLKLLLLVHPSRIYFGEKDYQQLQLVKGLVEAFFLNIEVVGCPTVREASGLAMSSRNERLSSTAAQKAALLYQFLKESKTCQEAKEKLEKAGFRVEYVEEKGGRRLAAVWLEGVRLIDNIAFA